MNIVWWCQAKGEWENGRVRREGFRELSGGPVVRIHHTKATGFVCNFISCYRINVNTYMLCSAVSDSLWPYGLQPTRLLCPWNFPSRILERVAISYCRRFSQPRDQTHVSCVSCISRQIDALPLHHFETQVPYQLRVSLKLVPSLSLGGLPGIQPHHPQMRQLYSFVTNLCGSTIDLSYLIALAKPLV